MNIFVRENAIPWNRIGLGIVGILFGAYLYPPVLYGFGELFDVVFGWVDMLLPFYAAVGVLAIVTAVYSASIHTVISIDSVETTDTDRMESLHTKRLEAEAAGDQERLKEIYAAQGEVMAEEFESLKQHFKPFLWVLIGSMPVVIWVYWKVTAGMVAVGEQIMVFPVVGVTAWDSSIVVVEAWLVWYFLCSFTANILCRRALRWW